MTKQLTLYTARASVLLAHYRTRLTTSRLLRLYNRFALTLSESRLPWAISTEAKAKFTRYEIDLANKPTWYAPQVNPASKVPAIAYGGPEVPPDQPSPESVKINESLVLVEFVADLFPESGILPTDPVLRAKARLFIDAVGNRLSANQYKVINLGEGDPELLVQGLEAIQALLPAQGFAVGEFSIADIAIAPFLARLQLLLENDLGAWEGGKGTGPKILEQLQQPKLARLWEYAGALAARPSVSSTWHKDIVLGTFTKRFEKLRAEKFGA